MYSALSKRSAWSYISPTSQEVIRVLSCATSDVSDSNSDPPSAEPKVVRDSGVFRRHVPLINTG
jgi:hypothetical protein